MFQFRSCRNEALKHKIKDKGRKIGFFVFNMPYKKIIMCILVDFRRWIFHFLTR